MRRRTALVTGASRGIGAAIAVALARQGVGVVGIHYAADAAAAQAVAREVERHGAAPVVLQADFSEGAAAADSLADAWRKEVQRHGLGGTDVLVSNAGINGAQALDELTGDVVGRVLTVNLAVPLMLLHHLSPHLSEGARVIGVSSGYARIAAPTHVAYSAAKAGLEAAFTAVAVELGKRSITVNTVRPGVIDTDINAEWIDEPGAREAVAAESALGRVGQPRDVADIVAFLAGESSRWITGQSLDATGGVRL